MLFVSGSRRAQRLAICESCNHYEPSTKSCGPLVIGKAVDHEGEVRRLCGCIMPLKTQLKTSGCPLGKWHAVVKPEDVDQLREFLNTIKTNTSAEQREYMRETLSNLTGRRIQHTNCKACYRNMLKELRTIVEQHDKRNAQAHRD